MKKAIGKNAIGLSVGVLALAGVTLGGLWLQRVEAQPTGFLPYQDAAAVAAGQELYADNCAACHGGQLQGEANWRERDADGYLPAPPHDPSGHTWHHPDLQLFMITKFGTEAMVGNGYKSRMGAYEEILSDEEIVQILAFIKSTWPTPIVDQHNARNAAAAAQGG